MATDSQIVEVMRLLGIESSDFHFGSRSELDSLKKRSRKRLRRMALQYHPDRTSCPRKQELFRVATQVVADLETTEYVQPRTRKRKRYSYSFTVNI
jgi:hypothetical protein